MAGQTVYSGITAEVDISFQYGWTASAQDALNSIVAQIQGSGLLSVEDASLSLNTQLNPLDLIEGQAEAVMHVTPLATMDTGAISDAVGQAIATVSQGSGYTVSVPTVAGAPTGQGSSTLTPGNALSGLWSGVQSLFSGLQTTTITLIIGVVIVVTLVLVLIGFSPQAAGVAKAALL